MVDVFGIKKTYIPPATPQINGHIESYHSTIQKLICDKYSFQTIEDAISVFQRFFITYNTKRILSCLHDFSPKQFIALWGKGRIGIKKRNNSSIFFFKEESTEIINSSNNSNFIKSNTLSI